jgi:hypothetical protein
MANNAQRRTLLSNCERMIVTNMWLNQRKHLFWIKHYHTLITLPDPGRQFFVVVLVTKKRMGKKKERFFFIPVLFYKSYLVDPASSHMLVSKIKPCMSKYKQLCTVKLRMAH